jgi:hypothetical protein
LWAKRLEEGKESWFGKRGKGVGIMNPKTIHMWRREEPRNANEFINSTSEKNKQR